jgi:hypothetical protein
VHVDPCMLTLTLWSWREQVAKEPIEFGKDSTAIAVFKQSALCHGLFAEG